MNIAPLEAVIANQELSRRRPLADRQQALDAALRRLSSELATSPRQVLQKLTDAARELCQSGSAGVSLLEADGERRYFRWHAVSGPYASLLWSTLPRESSPCGTVLDRKAAQLMVLPERHFAPLAEIVPKVQEVLLVPFEVRGELIGTVWVVSHDLQRKFDREDRRLVGALAVFAARAYERLSSLGENDVVALSRMAQPPQPQELRRAVVQKNILVVDDNVDVGDALALSLRVLGHEVRVARDGRSAIAAVAQSRPDIVLLDIVMPGMTGYEVARKIREQAGASVRIVALSGFAADEDGQRAMDAGFDQHLVKPVDPGFLKSLLG